MKNWKILARHKWVTGCTITESYSIGFTEKRFTATICGWRNFKIWQGRTIDAQSNAELVKKTVESLKQRIIDNDKTVFEIEGFIL